MKTTIQELAEQYQQDLVDIRRHLHAHPELSFHEEKRQLLFPKNFIRLVSNIRLTLEDMEL